MEDKAISFSFSEFLSEHPDPSFEEKVRICINSFNNDYLCNQSPETINQHLTYLVRQTQIEMMKQMGIERLIPEIELPTAVAVESEGYGFDFYHDPVSYFDPNSNEIGILKNVLRGESCVEYGVEQKMPLISHLGEEIGHAIRNQCYPWSKRYDDYLGPVYTEAIAEVFGKLGERVLLQVLENNQKVKKLLFQNACDSQPKEQSRARDEALRQASIQRASRLGGKIAQSDLSDPRSAYIVREPPRRSAIRRRFQKWYRNLLDRKLPKLVKMLSPLNHVIHAETETVAHFRGYDCADRLDLSVLDFERVLKMSDREFKERVMGRTGIDVSTKGEKIFEKD